MESVVDYMKDSLGLSYHEIAKELNRDDRTIWTVYHRASKKKGDKK
jgi:DNA-directed RNA polymerase specialized sigma24 family protein